MKPPQTNQKVFRRKPQRLYLLAVGFIAMPDFLTSLKFTSRLQGFETLFPLSIFLYITAAVLLLLIGAALYRFRMQNLQQREHELAALVQERTRELQDAQEQLELRVQVRTAVLRKTNEKLQAEIQERERAENEVRRLNEDLERRVAERTAALRESETKFRQLAENIEAVFWIESPNCEEVLYLSPAYEKVWGRSPERLVQNPMQFFEAVHPEDREFAVETYQHLIRGEAVQLEYRIVRPDGAVRWVRDRGFPIRNDAGEIIRVGGISEDITERKLLEEKIHRHAQELERLVAERTARIQELERQRAESEKLAATGRMAARIAHEINNPLAGIKNSFLLIKDGIPPAHRHYAYVGRIEKEIERIAAIVRQMFPLYRRDQYEPRRFRIDDMLRDLVAILETHRREKQVLFEIDTSRAPEMLYMPEGLLKQVLYNLIQNAFDASRPQSFIMLTAALDTDSFHLTVADQGHGIPAEARPHIFEPFFTTKDGQTTNGGVGLGLSVSKNIIEALAGTLTFESVVGEGTVFRIRLPRHAVLAQAQTS